MSILDRFAVSRETAQNRRAISEEAYDRKTGVVENALDVGGERSQGQRVILCERRRRRSVFRPRAMISRTESNCEESRRISHRDERRKPDLDRSAARVVHAVETCGQRRSIVGNDEVARSKKRGKFAARQMSHPAAGVYEQELCGS